MVGWIVGWMVGWSLAHNTTKSCHLVYTATAAFEVNAICRHIIYKIDNYAKYLIIIIGLERNKTNKQIYLMSIPSNMLLMRLDF